MSNSQVFDLDGVQVCVETYEIVDDPARVASVHERAVRAVAKEFADGEENNE